MAKRFSRRNVIRLAIVGAGASVLAACGATPTPQVIEKVVEKEVTKIVEGTPQTVVETVVVVETVEKVVTATAAPKVKQQVIFWSELVGSKEEGRAALLSAFNAASDDIEVVHEAIFGSDETNQKFLTALSGGVVPDLLGNDAAFIPGYVEIDALTELGPYMEASQSVKPDGFPQGILALCMYNGKVWGLPVYAETMVLYYNKDLMTAAGLDPEKPPRDWTSLREGAIAMTKRDAAGKLEVAGCLLGTWSAPRIFIPMLYAWGGSLYSVDLSKATFNGAEGKELLGLYVDLIYKDKVTEVGWGEEFEDSVNEPFIAGKAGLMFEAPAATRRIVRWRPEFQNFGIVGLPGGPKGFAQTAETAGLMIPQGAKHKDAAWRVMEYWMQPKVMVRWSKDVFRPPSTLAALEDEALMSDPRIAPIAEALKNYTIELPQTPKWGEIFNALAAEIELALVGDKTAAQALDDAAVAVDQILARA